MSKVLDSLIGIAEEVTASLGLTLVDTRFGQQGRRRSLKVTIYNPAGQISIEDCEKVSRRLDEVLESQDPPVVSGSYVLEVESPGLERQLKTEREFAVFNGQRVSVESQDKIKGLGTQFLGTLQGMNNGRIKLTELKPVVSSKKKKKDLSPPPPPGEIELDFSNLVRVRLHPFEQDSALTTN